MDTMTYNYTEPTLSTKGQRMRDILADYIALISHRLPDDVTAKLEELSKIEVDPLQKLVYDTMMENQLLANKLKRPSCQDTGALQFFIKCGAQFPLLGELNQILKDAVYRGTKKAPLRHNAVQTFDEYNTGMNIGDGIPSIFLQVDGNGTDISMYVYMAGGGCTLPGAAKVLMPGEGYEGVVRFVMDRMTSYGINACPPLLVGVGVATSVETAALNSKLALMRRVDSENPNANAAKLEHLLEDGINHIGLGPQGFGGQKSVMGVNVENTARHPSTIGVAVSTGCWSHRRGLINFDADLNYDLPLNKGVELS
ncbi:L(+)-tartrate dehydratase subunit alpha [Lactiplantibacillus plantarum]|uniref:L(+)-tartrate dehydratase subunit alpha n=1 Tax=Lactiplantibacillus plantarum TaxID=1590 RepID=UPI00034ECDF0|nr:L(+)-tartrate dehydratase subunit alpha [Lactiplantibacillus plantarum]ASD33033.1 L(+)-tartrate dehydratase subunit alpha [Lactiplantibacillus plantarum]AXI12112.1 L(+)-tartrate dehydratase subunit alpha [Lactiplantibacillus plantarum]EPD24012.1 tartrate dehydratase subunit alpha [Lactiplantibacillus plantarum IPLA88]KOE73768.1 tartrate dehydratase [Lactiplantibacillus plantarum]KZT80431.1 L-tartrate dehydratase alpha subunit [Lactiplantibacillus plantarum]